MQTVQFFLQCVAERWTANLSLSSTCKALWIFHSFGSHRKLSVVVPRQPTVSCKLGLNQQLSYRCVIKLQHKIPANLRSEALGLAMIRLLRCSSISSHSLYNHGHCSHKVADLTVHVYVRNLYSCQFLWVYLVRRDSRSGPNILSFWKKSRLLWSAQVWDNSFYGSCAYYDRLELLLR